ncbi:MAG: 50S ribosomal protein L10 [Planctomycetes bacterium]|nr:50S ribosomal protein L10 [Planctomycetota bacterium]
MPNQVNQILLSELEQEFQNMGSCVVLEVGPVQPKEDIELRSKLREVGANYRVVRSRLAEKAFAKVGLDMSEAMKGRTGIATAEKEGAIAAAKVLRDWIKTKKESPIAIKGGVVEGETYVGDSAALLAELPDRDTINTKIVSAISGPARSLASVLNAVAGGMARCIQAKIDKGE